MMPARNADITAIFTGIAEKISEIAATACLGA